MRDLDYRRKQEAKHYKKRLKTAIAIKRFDKMNISDTEDNYIPTYRYKKDSWPAKHISEMSRFELESVEKNQYKRWKFQLKNNSLNASIDTWSKRYCRRTRRHYQKMVDYKLPDKKFLVRAQVIYPRDIV